MKSLRGRFPSLAACTYLNTAAGAPIPDVAHDAAARYYKQSFEDGDVHWDEWMARVDEARARVGVLVGASSEDVAFVGNASAGLNAAAELDEPGSFAFAESEFPSCTLPWLRRGFEPHAWRVADDGSFDADDVAGSFAADTKVAVVSWVQFASGFRADLMPMADLCRKRGVRLVVDATQAVAAFPLDAAGIGIDVLVFSGYKWLTSGYGVAGLIKPGGYGPLGAPRAGWRSQQQPYLLEAARLDPDRRGAAAEAGHPPFPNVFAMGASAAMWASEGPQQTGRRVLRLARHLHDSLDAAGIPVLSTRIPEHTSGIVMAGVTDPAEVAQRLAERGILVSARRAGLRVSMHGYNTPEDIDRLAAALAELNPCG